MKPYEYDDLKYRIQCCIFAYTFFSYWFIASSHNFIVDNFLVLLKVAFVGFVTCTIFIRSRLHPTDENNGILYNSALFYGLVHMLFNGFSELSLMISRLPVFYKQRGNLFYPSWAWSLSTWILGVPYSFVEAFIWTVVTYYTIGFAPAPGRYICLHPFFVIWIFFHSD